MGLHPPSLFHHGPVGFPARNVTTGLLTAGVLGCRNFSCVLHLQIAGGLSCFFIGIASHFSLSHGLFKGVTSHRTVVTWVSVPACCSDE